MCVTIRLVSVLEPGVDRWQWGDPDGAILIFYISGSDVGEYSDKGFQVVSIQSGHTIVEPIVEQVNSHERNGASHIVVGG